MNDPGLLELFTRLKEAGLPLGLEEYNLFLQATQAGFGTQDRNTLAQLCRILWIKSDEDNQIFQEYFNELIPEQLTQSWLSNNLREKEADHLNRVQDTVNSQKRFSIRMYIIGGGITFLIIIMSIFWRRGLNPPLPNPGVLSFYTSFFLNGFSARENNVAIVSVVRLEGSNGRVSATLEIIEPNGDYYPRRIEKKYYPIDFADGESGIKDITIPIIDDYIFEGNEVVQLTLLNPQGGIKLGDPITTTLNIIDDETNLGNLVFIEVICIWLPITFVSIFIFPIIWKLYKVRQKINSTNDNVGHTTRINLPRATLSSEVMQLRDNELQGAKTIEQFSDRYPTKFPIITKNLPITSRQMKQSWRYLRQFVRAGAPTELDIDATIQQIGQQGMLINPVLVPHRINRLELLLLIDQDGSMVPFHHLAQELVETAKRAGRFREVRVYYFHNCPSDYLYRDPFHLEAEPIEGALAEIPKSRNACLIISDAGAARSGFNPARRRLTKIFLKELQQHVRNVVWLNPVPQTRWEHTTATEIAKLVPMFEINRKGLYTAIDTLRGHIQHSQ